MKNKVYILAGILFGVLFISIQSCNTTSKTKKSVDLTDTLNLNNEASGSVVQLQYITGENHNHPLMAIWISDTDSNYIQTIYVAQSIAKGVFGNGSTDAGFWEAGPLRRPAALPYWSHMRGIKETDGLYIPTSETPMSDAYTGATPKQNANFRAITDETLPNEFIVFFEINQTWDWNEYWTNNKYLDDEDYKTSCQPSLIYAANVLKSDTQAVYPMVTIGHGHYSGRNGNLYTTLETLTTAMSIVDNVTFEVVKW
jgi:hypothetical protein